MDSLYATPASARYSCFPDFCLLLQGSNPRLCSGFEGVPGKVKYGGRWCVCVGEREEMCLAAHTYVRTHARTQAAIALQYVKLVGTELTIPDPIRLAAPRQYRQCRRNLPQPCDALLNQECCGVWTKKTNRLSKAPLHCAEN